MSGEPEEFLHEVSTTIRAHAMSFPESEEGTSCVNRAFKAGGKNFVFLGEKDDECTIRLKIDASIPELQERAEADPDRWQVGKGGWTLIRFAPDDPPASADLERWITESFMLLAPKRVSKLLNAE